MNTCGDHIHGLQQKNKGYVAVCLFFAAVVCGDIMMAQEPVTVLDFNSPESKSRWRIVNDGVMGGLSQSRIFLTPERTGVFEGNVSLKNNGGFASMRSEPAEFGLAGRRGLSLRVKGDGRRYQLRLRIDGRWDGVAYARGFDSAADEWITVNVDFRDCSPTFRGRRVVNAPPLDPSRIRQIGFFIGDKQEGVFRLEIDSISGY